MASTPGFSTINYRAAVALNNTGVSLLERGAPELALKTFKDSINTLRQEFFPQPYSAESRQMMNLADRRLAAMSIASSAPYSRAPGVCVQSINYERESFHDLIFPPDHGCSPKTYFPARIECSTSDLGLHEDNKAACFECALIVYNFALAHLYLAEDVLNGRAGWPPRFSMLAFVHALRKCAVQLLWKVQRILRGSSKEHALSLWMTESRLALTCLSLVHIAQVTQLTGTRKEAEQALHRLCVAADAWFHWNVLLTNLLGCTALGCCGHVTSVQNQTWPARHVAEASQKQQRPGQLVRAARAA
jgi:hypothetical protein